MLLCNMRGSIRLFSSNFSIFVDNQQIQFIILYNVIELTKREL